MGENKKMILPKILNKIIYTNYLSELLYAHEIH